VPGWLLYIKPEYHGDEPAHIRSYAIAHKTFPHETTANQWFSESQFESYRSLGAHVAELICSGGQMMSPMEHPPFIDLLTLRKRADKYLNGFARQRVNLDADQGNELALNTALGTAGAESRAA
jgi:hypothetical protein